MGSPTNPDAKPRKKKNSKIESDDEKDDDSVAQSHLNVGGVWFEDGEDSPEEEYSGENGDLAGFTFLNPIPIEKDVPNGVTFASMNLAFSSWWIPGLPITSSATAPC